MVVNDFVQSSIAGGVVRDRSNTLAGDAYDAIHNENSVMFDGEERYELALRIKSYVEPWSPGCVPTPAAR
jgi:hypothetical protein